MELGGAGNGGFTGYRSFSQPNSSSSAPAGGIMRSVVTDMSVQLPSASKTNHMIASPSSTLSPAAGADHTAAMMDGECTIREQDRFMPIANVIRIMRKILPQHAKISDDAKETIQECVSEYISFITGEANDRCQREQRKTITAEDVLWAMSKLGFDDYIEPLTLYLHRYRELDGGERGASLRAAGADHHPLVGKRANSFDHLHHPAAAATTTAAGAFAPYPHFHLSHYPSAPAAFFTTAAAAHVPINHPHGFLKEPSSGSTAGGGGPLQAEASSRAANGGDHKCKE